MTTSIHPNEEMLGAYSAASIEPSLALPVAAHLEFCSHCRTRLRQLNQVGSELMRRLKPSAPSDSLKQDLLDRLDDLPPESVDSAPVPEPRHGDVPRCLRQFVSDYERANWKRVSLDIESAELCREPNGNRVELLRIRPGGKATTHTHLGDEYTVILKGSFSDEDGLYRQGDFMLRDRRHRHTPVATLDQPCICLAVTEGPVQFTTWFGRLLNPLLRRGYSMA